MKDRFSIPATTANDSPPISMRRLAEEEQPTFLRDPNIVQLFGSSGTVGLSIRSGEKSLRRSGRRYVRSAAIHVVAKDDSAADWANADAVAENHLLNPTRWNADLFFRTTPLEHLEF